MNHAEIVLKNEISNLEARILDFGDYRTSERLITQYRKQSQDCREALRLINSYKDGQSEAEKQIVGHKALKQELEDL